MFFSIVLLESEARVCVVEFGYTKFDLNWIVEGIWITSGLLCLLCVHIFIIICLLKFVEHNNSCFVLFEIFKRNKDFIDNHCWNTEIRKGKYVLTIISYNLKIIYLYMFGNR